MASGGGVVCARDRGVSPPDGGLGAFSRVGA